MSNPDNHDCFQGMESRKFIINVEATSSSDEKSSMVSDGKHIDSLIRVIGFWYEREMTSSPEDLE
ncbi:hypothetical protein Pla110_24740 [Polystyrenella longa]|uniref:Uncharacterized protein n=1 Tax=Polystyrenella longa TaxID=2528007 RepID=A0A518CND1_9PLAN|nr:hypothetical protein Pla110_24740 [Polystyrenella longa]